MNRWHCFPAELYALVERTPATVLLECAKPSDPRIAAESGTERRSESLSRLFTAPLRICVANQPAELAPLFAEIESAVAAGLFAAGFFTYECGNFFEPTACLPPGPASQPLAWFGIYHRPWLFDHRTGAFLDGDPPALAPLRSGVQNENPPAGPPPDCTLGLAEQQYVERIAAIHEWIRAGDVYQLNFTVPLRMHAPDSSAALYAQLRGSQPVEYGAFLHWQPGRQILSFSPELFFRLENSGDERRITTRPMKGTTSRGRTTREDRARSEWLRKDPKNRSENVMIVDLLRNDLGRLCNFGSVRAENLFAVERHPTLWQMTSTVTGTLRPEIDFQQIFRALFPCGSVTGAPKVRAMQLLARIERLPRGVYTGAIGFFSRRQTVFNVAIRTLALDGEHGQMGVGSGIVIDSVPAEEFRECLLKAEFLTRRAEPFSLVETMLWQSEYSFIELHLDRLEDSARYFAFPCDRAETMTALLSFASALPDKKPRKVRLLLDPDGALRIAAELLPENTNAGNAKLSRVRLASRRTDPQDPMLFHKTTHRPVYAEALQAATQAGFDDVLFLNLRGEVTEGAIHNIFIQKDGRWFTPPIECGVLAGVFRRHLLQSMPNAEGKVLYLQDLRQADAVHLSNAVRGLRRAEIDWEDSSLAQC
jgi:para-aminobenzoate synthetase/4-amino-4-deoxychorismate lyase